MKNELPNPDVLIWHCRDFIMRSTLTRKALDTSWPQFHVAIHDLVEEIERLAHSCHLPEFTDHALPHICSLVDRIEQWTYDDGKYLTDNIDSDQAAQLLIATLFHDLGMLSQSEADLPCDARPEDTLSVIGDLPTWVRQTHVKRLPSLAKRVTADLGHHEFMRDPKFFQAIEIGAAHQEWPWKWHGILRDNPDFGALAAVLAVSDLLDEDCARCDTKTLIYHRRGTELNMAHWIRHSLSQGRILIVNGEIKVHMVSPPNAHKRLEPVYAALRNHYRLVKVYIDKLKHIGVNKLEPVFTPAKGVPREETTRLGNWERLEGFGTESALVFQLLKTFMAEATMDEKRLDPPEIHKFSQCELEVVDLTILQKADGVFEPISSDERTFYALSEGL